MFYCTCFNVTDAKTENEAPSSLGVLLLPVILSSGFGPVIRERTRTPEFGIQRAQISRLCRAPASNWLISGTFNKVAPSWSQLLDHCASLLVVACHASPAACDCLSLDTCIYGIWNESCPEKCLWVNPCVKLFKGLIVSLSLVSSRVGENLAFSLSLVKNVFGYRLSL